MKKHIWLYVTTVFVAMLGCKTKPDMTETFGAQQTINVGTTANDGTGDTLRTAFQKANSNFTELYSNVAVNSNELTTLNTLIGNSTNVNLFSTDAFTELSNVIYPKDGALWTNLNARTSLDLNYATGSRGAVLDANGVITNALATDQQINWLKNVTSDVQTQLDQRVTTNAGTMYAPTMPAVTANRALVTDASSIITNSAVTAVELGYLTGLSENVQTALTDLGSGGVPSLTNLVDFPSWNGITNHRVFAIESNGWWLRLTNDYVTNANLVASTVHTNWKAFRWDAFNDPAPNFDEIGQTAFNSSGSTSTNSALAYMDINGTPLLTNLPMGLIDARAFGLSTALADNSVVLSNAIVDIASTSFNGLYIPRGDYTFTNTVELQSNLRIVGDGEGTFLDFSTMPTNLNAFEWRGTSLDDLVMTDMRIRGHQADDDDVNGSGGCINIIQNGAGNLERLIFHRLRIERFRTGILVDNGGYNTDNQWIHITDNFIDQMAAAGIWLRQSRGAVIQGNYIDGRRTGIGDARDTEVGIFVQTDDNFSKHTIISGNHIRSVRKEAVVLMGRWGVVAKNTIETSDDSTTVGIRLHPSVQTTPTQAQAELHSSVVGNTVHGDGTNGSGIFVGPDPANNTTGIGYVNIVGNNVSEVANGIVVGSNSVTESPFNHHITLTANTVFNCATRALWIDESNDILINGLQAVGTGGTDLVLVENGGKNIRFDHCVFDGLGNASAGASGIRIENDVEYVVVENSTFKNFDVYGVYVLNTANNVTVRGCRFVDDLDSTFDTGIYNDTTSEGLPIATIFNENNSFIGLTNAWTRQVHTTLKAPVDYGLTFDGTANADLYSASFTNTIGTGDFTIRAIFKMPSAAPANDTGLGGVGPTANSITGADSFYWFLGGPNGEISIQKRSAADAGQSVDAVVSSKVYFGEVIDLVSKNTGNELFTYINGVLVSRATAFMDENVDSTHYHWGQPVTDQFTGNLYKFQIWDDALSDAEIADLPEYEQTDNLLLDLDLTLGSGTAPLNKASSSYNATIASGVTWTKVRQSSTIGEKIYAVVDIASGSILGSPVAAANINGASGLHPHGFTMEGLSDEGVSVQFVIPDDWTSNIKCSFWTINNQGTAGADIRIQSRYNEVVDGDLSDAAWDTTSSGTFTISGTTHTVEKHQLSTAHPISTPGAHVFFLFIRDANHAEDTHDADLNFSYLLEFEHTN